ncbi:hypothetical protein, partial [Acidithiobacillus thiooxidans]|uniref:hypothetical protein n=1 Tax=Acidithiobacillus thiooxidans TaxID=930 RepID=UPI00242A4342
TPSPPEIIKTRLLRLNQETHYKTHFRERYPLDCRSKAGWRLEPLKNGRLRDVDGVTGWMTGRAF